MSFVYQNRPGVYAGYDVSGVYSGAIAGKVIAVAAQSTLPAKVYVYTDYASAYRRGDNSQLGKMLKLLYENGAYKVLAYPVGIDNIGVYDTAITALFAAGEPDYLVLGSDSEEIQLLAKQQMEQLQQEQRECICFMGMTDAGIDEIAARAEKLNSERVVLLGQNVTLEDETQSSGGSMAAAALAAQLSAQTDPAVPLHGMVLEGLADTEYLTDSQLDALIQSGVTTLEAVNGSVSIIRGLTTRTKTDNQPDTTLGDLNTIMVIDTVIPGLRELLRKKFTRSKNNETTRTAILHQMVTALEEYLSNEIIDSYSDLQVTADPKNAGVCLVSFRFAVTRGINLIYLTAHITV